MNVEIENNLNKNVLDFLIMQTIAECKINRQLTNPEDPLNGLNFYTNYAANNSSFYNIDGTPNRSLINQFKVSVGAFANLSEIEKYNNNESIDKTISQQEGYEGGAGKFTKLSNTQVDNFISTYDIVSYHSNDNSGFSATVFENRLTHEKTIAFRSTEYGEDFIKDAMGADREIKYNGTAFAQNAAMIKYIEELKANSIINTGETLNVTGYSLGSHLASSFYKMYGNEFNIPQMINMNGPGVGELSSDSNSYLDLKDDLKNYNILTELLQETKIAIEQKIITDGPLIVMNDYIDAINSFTNYTEDLKAEAINFLNNLSLTDFSNVFNSNLLNAKIGTTTETEGTKSSAIIDNQNNNYINSTIYGQELYKQYKDYLVDKYDAQNAGNTYPTSVVDSTINPGEEVSTGFYGNIATWLSGLGFDNKYDVLANDYKLVANSNYYTNPNDLIVEDRVELEKLGARIPVELLNLYNISKDNTGDFGNTHSITLLNKTLSLMTFLTDIEGSSSIDVKKYTSLISASTAEKASSWITDYDEKNITVYKNLNYGDGNSIAQIINMLSNAILPSDPNRKDIIFSNTLNGWADVNKLEDLEQRKIEIKNALNGMHITINPLYTINENDLDLSDSDGLQIESKLTMFLKAMQDNPEGQAYRYAIEKSNSFVILGLDYDTMDYSSKEMNAHSEEWYKSKIEVLYGLIQSNVDNSGDLLSKYNVLVDDQGQGLVFHTVDEKYATKTYTDMVALENDYRAGGAYHSWGSLEAKYYYESRSANFHYDGALAMFDKDEPIISDGENINPITNLSKDKDILRANAVDISSNIYFFNPFATIFTSSRANDSEKIFIKNDMDTIRKSWNGEELSAEQIKLLNDYNPGYIVDENGIKQLQVNVRLEGGDDYIEILNPTETALIDATKGRKDYNLNNKETTITDPDKKGTITLDGILLKGGNLIDNTHSQQVETIDGVDHIIDYYIDNEYLSHSKLMIVHQNTGHKIYINDMSDLGNGTAFNFERSEGVSIQKTLPISAEAFLNPTAIFTDKSVHIQNRYQTISEFEDALKVTVNIGSANSIFYQENDSLIIYDKNNPSNKVIIDNFYELRHSSIYNTTIIGPNGPEDIYTPVTGSVSLTDLTIPLSSTYPINIENILRNDGSTTIDFRNEKYILEGSVFDSIVMEKSGLDLLFVNPNMEPITKYTVKNYFAFDHTNHTNIFIGNESSNTEIPASNIKNYFIQYLSSGNDAYVMPVNSQFSIINGYLGDDVIIGSDKAETFQSTGNMNPELAEKYSDGNDIFTGGEGADKFVFSGFFGSDIITDFSANDKVYMNDYSGMRREDSDLVLISINNATIRINNYFKNIDYKTNSGLFLNDGSPYVLSPVILNALMTKEIEGENYTQETQLENSAYAIKNIKTNEKNNTITITRNDTIVSSYKDVRIITDGNDVFNINNTELIPDENDRNDYRTEFITGLKSGNDVINNASFKVNGEYGDIITLENVSRNDVVFNIKKENNVLKSFTAILNDGSSLNVEMKEDTDENAEVIKIGEEIITLADIIDYVDLQEKTGTAGQDEFDYANSFKSYDIQALAGDDTISGGHGNDFISSGKGFDDVYLSSGQDTYTFQKGSDIDIFHFKETREKLDLTFIVDPLYNVADIKYYYDGVNKKIYLKFSENDGVVFNNAEWIDLVLLSDGLKVKDANGATINVPEEVITTTEMPFTPIAKILSGSSSANTLTVDNTYNHAVFGNGGNDTIISQGSDHNKSLIFGGTGNDNITANQGDIINVRSGDGTDTITSTGNNYLINLLRSNSIVNNGEEKLFDISVANTNDLSIRYGGTNDKLILKNYFNPNNTVEKDITVALFENNHNTTKIYSLQEILDDLDITRASLQSSGTRTINQSDIDFDEESDAGKIIGGEIAYNYLSNGNAYSDQSEASILLNGMSNGKMLMNKN